MKLTIIPADGAVYKNNYAFIGLNLSFVPNNIHALQWYETEGEIEFIGKPKPQNEIISALPSWVALCLNKWDEEKIKQEAVENAIKESVANQPQTTGTMPA
jgi:hypothetical protein